MKERKKPGPKSEKPLEHDVKVRVDNETLAKIEFCKEKLQTTRADVLRKGANMIYDDLNK